MHKDRTTLDGDYAAFGYVTEGMDVVDAIASVPTNSWDDRPYVDVVVTTIKFAD
jgi:peptidyl-prolyl cis-trans isomerase B (cyclophilin B)